MSDSVNDEPVTVTSYDLISINNVSLPDVQKGEVTVQPNPKYHEYEAQTGNKVIDEVENTMIKGMVSYDGLLQAELQTVYAAVSSSVVGSMTIYNPMSGQTKTFDALIVVGAITKIIHDEGANAWSFSFDFEEI